MALLVSLGIYVILYVCTAGIIVLDRQGFSPRYFQNFGFLAAWEIYQVERSEKMIKKMKKVILVLLSLQLFA